MLSEVVEISELAALFVNFKLARLDFVFANSHAIATPLIKRRFRRHFREGRNPSASREKAAKTDFTIIFPMMAAIQRQNRYLKSGLRFPSKFRLGHTDP
jgi:hypothetical protein